MHSHRAWWEFNPFVRMHYSAYPYASPLRGLREKLFLTIFSHLPLLNLRNSFSLLYFYPLLTLLLHVHPSTKVGMDTSTVIECFLFQVFDFEVLILRIK